MLDPDPKNRPAGGGEVLDRLSLAGFRGLPGVVTLDARRMVSRFFEGEQKGEEAMEKRERELVDREEALKRGEHEEIQRLTMSERMVAAVLRFPGSFAARPMGVLE
jgi:hypothetical protein